MRHKWTQHELDYIRMYYRGTRSAAEIAATLGGGITMWGVRRQAAKMGILRPRSPAWTEKELEILRDRIHTHSIWQIAKILRRTPNAVKIKATRLQLGMQYRDWYTQKEACEILGVDHRKLKQWIDCGALKATRHNGESRKSQEGLLWHITYDSLRQFLIKYSEELVGRNVDIQSIIWIVSGQ